MTAPWHSTNTSIDPDRLLQSITAHLPGAIYVYQLWPDGSAQLLYISDGVEDIYGYSSDAVRRRPQLLNESVHPDDRAAFETRLLDSFVAYSIWNHGFRIVRFDGEVRYVDAIAEPSRQDDGSIVWYGHIRDLTTVKAAEQERIDVVQRYRDAIERIGDGAWFYDALNDGFSFSASWLPRLGEGVPYETQNQQSWIRRIHPEHRQMVLDATQALIDGSSPNLSCEYRLKDKDGGYFWVHARGAITEWTQRGSAWILAGTISDISARKEAERQLRLQARAIASAPVGVFIADGRGTNLPLILVNPAGRQMLGLSLADESPPLLGVQELLGTLAARDSLALAVAAQSSWQGVIEYLDPYGVSKQLRVTVTADLDAEHARLFGILEDISADVALRDDLIDARETAEKANHAKSRFIAHVSHELRTPLHGIMGLSELGSADESLPAPARTQFTEINRAARHLLSLIGDIIDLSAMEAGRLALSVEPVTVTRIIDNVLRLAGPVAKEHRVTLFADEAFRSAGRVHADSTRATQVLLNLVSNGIKYNQQGGFVALRLLESPAGVLRIGVEDNGRGIPSDMVEHLFEQFNRLGRELSSIEGSGIGLTIARSLAEAMNGSLGVGTRGGSGSLFWLDLPVAPDGIDIVEPGHARVVHDGAPSGLRVLVAEDNTLSQDVFRQQLAKLGCFATIVGDGEAAWESIRRDRFDVLLTDVHMPGLDGLELTNRIRQAEQDDKAHRTYIVGVSANAMKDAERSALVHGMDSYITKPVTLDALREVFARQAISRAQFPYVHEEREQRSTAEDIAPPVNLSRLADLVGEESDNLLPFVDKLVVALADDAAALIGALDNRNASKGRALAHRLKTTAMTVEAHALTQLCGELEREELWDQVELFPTIALLRRTVEDVTAAVEQQRFRVALKY